MFRKAARVFIAVWLIATAQAAPAEKRVALVIGNTNYALAPLDNPKHDADDVSAALERLHFDVTELKDLTIGKFDAAIDAFEVKAKKADVAFFFFSGHGVQIDKRGYLAPVDIRAESETSALRELEAIQEIISRIENAARISVIVLDACRDSRLQERLRRIAAEKNKGFAPAKGLPPVSVVGSNTLIVYATAPGETASDGTGRNSPFTAALLKNIETPGLEIELMFKRVTADVLNATRGKQQPERLSRLQNELMLAPAPIAREGAEAFPLPKDMPPATITRPNDATAILQTPLELQTCDGVFVSVAEPESRLCIKPGSGESFRDCPDCPEMVVVPSGSFMMGSPESEPERQPEEESPQHRVTITKPFAVGKFAVTFAEWDACVTAGGCGGYRPDDRGWGRDDRPVINVNWYDAKDYVSWLSRKTGKDYRLLSEAEREYVSRAGTATPFWWGMSIAHEQANYKGGGRKGENRQKTVPVQSFNPNPWGLYQVHGNVWEVVEDCWHDDYNGAPTDGSAWACEDLPAPAIRRILRGGSWVQIPRFARAAARWPINPSNRSDGGGFRLARAITP